MNNISEIRKNECTGCMACEFICPVKAIHTQMDDYGFDYPKISNNLCIDCGKCLQICPGRATCAKAKSDITEAYAANWHDEQFNRNSSSGGVFPALAKVFLAKGGIVYGASDLMDAQGYHLAHREVATLEELATLQGSRYVQSSLREIYARISKRLQENKEVLFVGTPCQVAALKCVFSTADNLYCIDLVCHGVPSLQMLNDYISMLENTNHGKVVNVVFRDKAKGWEREEGTIYIKKNNVVKALPFDAFFSSYYGLFMRGEISRESCYNCKYACKDRVGDITIGDFWGIEETNPALSEMLDKKYGISVCLVNSSRGKKILDQATMLTMQSTGLSDVLLHNHNLNQPSHYSRLREMILKAYGVGGWQAVDKLYLKSVGLKPYVNSIWYRCAKKIKDSLLHH